VESNDVNLNNLFCLYESIGSGFPGSTVYSFEQFRIIKTPNAEWPNISYGFSDVAIDESAIEMVITEMKRLNMHPFVIANDLSGTFEKFRNKGFLPIDQWTAMHIKGLSARTDDKPGEETPYLVNKNEIESWTKLVSESLFKSKQLESSIFNNLMSNGTELIGLRVDGRLIGTAMIYIDDTNTAGVYMVCVDEHHRGKGFGKTIASFCLGRIRKKKLDACYLQATKIAVPLYESLGFVKTGKYFLYWKIK
jgi:predicted GNAT family acetyltransferase